MHSWCLLQTGSVTFKIKKVGNVDAEVCVTLTVTADAVPGETPIIIKDRVNNADITFSKDTQVNRELQ